MVKAIIAVVLIYAALSLILGLISQRISKDTSTDYFISSRSLNWFHLGLTVIATWYSTFAFIGAPGFYYQKGVTWLLVQGAFTAGSLPLFWFMGKKIWLLGRKKGFLTPADLLDDYYNSKTLRNIVAVISIFALVPYSLIQLIAIGKVLDSSTDGAVSYDMGVLLTVFVGAFYTFTGGVRAIVWTDIIQGILFTAVIVFGAGAALYAAGGLQPGFEASLAAKPEVFSIDPSQFGKSFTTITIWSFGFILLPHLWQRLYMAESGASFSKSMLVQGLMGFILVTFLMIIGTLAIGFMGAIDDPDKVMAMLYNEQIPYLVPLLVVATFAAGMSTLDSQLLTASSVIVHDIFKCNSNIQFSPQKERLLGKIAVVILLLVLLVIALMPEAQGPIIVMASKGIGIAFLLFVPLLGVLLKQNFSATSINAALIIGLTVLFGLEFDLLSYEIPYGFGPPIVAFLAQLAVVGLLYRPGPVTLVKKVISK